MNYMEVEVVVGVSADPCVVCGIVVNDADHRMLSVVPVSYVEAKSHSHNIALVERRSVGQWL
jgi:hypothetical protein